MKVFVQDFNFFSVELQKLIPNLSESNLVPLFAEYLDLKATEFIGNKDIELAMLRAKVAEVTPASDAQKNALKKLRDFYPEIKSEFGKALEKAGIKSLTDEDMNKLTMDQAGIMMTFLVPFRNKIGYRDQLPKTGFQGADERQLEDIIDGRKY